MKKLKPFLVVILLTLSFTTFSQSLSLRDLMTYVKEDASVFNDYVMKEHGYNFWDRTDDINATGNIYIKSEFFKGKSATSTIGKFTKYNREFISTVEVTTINKNYYDNVIAGLTSENFEYITKDYNNGATWVMYRKLLQGSGYIFGVIIHDDDLESYKYFIQYTYL